MSAAEGHLLIDEASRPAPRGLVLAVALLTMIGPFSIDAYLPSFPEIEAAFGAGRAAMAQTLSFYLIAFGAGTLAWGPLSDRFGRRRTTLAALAAYVATAAACALAQDFSALLLARIAQGLAASGGVVIGRAMIRDAFAGARAQRAMSQVMLVFALAPALAPIVGGWLHVAFGWRSVFVFLALFGALLIALVSLAIPETLHAGHRQSLHPAAVSRAYGRALSHGRFLALVSTIAALFGGMFLYIAGSPALIFQHLHLGAESFAVQFVPMVAGLMTGSSLSSWLAHRWPPQRTIFLAFVVVGAAVVLNLSQAAALGPAVWNVIGPLVLYAVGVALAMPSLTVLALDCFPHHRGMASAVQGFVQMMSNAAIAGVAVPLFSGTVFTFAAGQAGLAALGFGLWAVSGRRGYRAAP